MKKTLKQLRKLVGLTQEEAAGALGVSHDTLSRWENGSTHPTAPQIVDICRVYKCDFADINWKSSK